MVRRTSDDRRSADFEAGTGRGRFGSFLGGVVLALVVLAAAAVAVSLLAPPPGEPPPTVAVEAVGTAPVASEEQMAEGEPFSAGGSASGGEPFSADPEPTAEPATGPSDGSDSAAEVTEAPEGADAAPVANEAPDVSDAASVANEAPEGGRPEVSEPPAPAEPVTTPDAGNVAAPANGIAPDGEAGEPSVIAALPQAPAGQEVAEQAPISLPALHGSGDPPEAPSPAPELAGPDQRESDSVAPPVAESEPDTEAAVPQPGELSDTIPASPTPTPGETLAVAPAAESEAPAPETGAAMARNASAFDAPRQSPLLAVVLVGENVAALTAERLSLLTMPLTVAIPPDLPGAAEIGAAARAAGHEVLTDVSPAEGAEDGAGTARLAALDTAVGATATGAPADAGLLEPLLAEAARQGLAWVDPGVGGPAERRARELGVPYTHANRRADHRDPEQLFRAIDSAARQARQWGTAVLFLDAGEPALQALVRWGLQEHPDNPLWFAPISAVIERRARP